MTARLWKSLRQSSEALVRGYLLFDVNGKKFLAYHTALSARKENCGDVYFNGWHIFKGWVCFFERFGCCDLDAEIEKNTCNAALKEGSL